MNMMENIKNQRRPLISHSCLKDEDEIKFERFISLPSFISKFKIINFN